MTKREDQIGKYGQTRAAVRLESMGLKMVEPIGTPVRLIPHPTAKGYYRVIFGQTVSGDHRAVGPGGRSVLAETKTIMGRNLQWSDFREHQPGALSRHADLGGLSLVVWVAENGIYVIDWRDLI